ncbi:MAG: mechanosensitive ion channel, partial [Chlamydiota bacterium]|nr:mechanosensitive ion channel [Chlamydiota bacterium]
MNETQILTQYFYSAMVLLCSVTIGFGVHFIVFFIIGRIAKKLNHPILLHLKQYWAAPCYLLFPVLVAYLSSPMFRVPDGLLDVYRHVLSLVFIASVTWLANRSVLIFRTFMLSRYNISDSDNLQARKIITQIAVLERILFVIIMIVGISSMLVTFNNIRQLGVSILASAGIIGIIVGLAAQKSIGTMLAGVQIAITQPIRLDDVVIVEGEWGRIEEITLTYVAIRIWDLRRLIVPITYFIEKSFQNWTRVSADLLGSVFLYTDYTVPIDVLREKLKRLLSASPYWDQKVCNVQVTDAKEQTLELRALMSAADSSSLWNLRCDVREK